MSDFTDHRVGRADPDLESNGETSLLDLLKDISAPVEPDPILLPVRTRDGYAVRYSLVIDADRLKIWNRQATSQGKTDEIKFASIVLANLCVGLVKNGVDLVDNGDPVTFAHPFIWNSYGVDNVAAAVRKFYGLDTYLASTCNSLLGEAGVGEDVIPLDPTNGS